MLPVRVMLIHRSDLVRANLGALITRQPGLDVVAETADLEDAARLVEATQPSVVVMESASRSKAPADDLTFVHAGGRPRVLAIVPDSSLVAARSTFSSGVHGCIAAHNVDAELIDGIRAVGRGERFIGPALAHEVIIGILLTPRTRAELPRQAAALLNAP